MKFRKKIAVARPQAAAGTTLIFDADDTLWDTQPLYEESKWRFFQLMGRTGFPAEEVASLLEATDHANVAKFGFSKVRFPKSMRDTYAELCKKYGRRYSSRTARRALEIGQTIFERSPTILEGVEEALAKLSNSRFNLVLATKGDRAIQSVRIRMSGLDAYFRRIYILKEKRVREFKQIIAKEGIQPAHGWSIGNSAKSDINPALAAGLNAIWIHRETWIYESIEPISSDRLFTAESISEVPGIVMRSGG